MPTPTWPTSITVLLVAVILASTISACKGGINPGGPDPVSSPSPSPTPRANVVILETDDYIERYEGAGRGVRAPETGTYIVELTYAPAAPQGRADLSIRAEGFPVRYLARVEGDEQPKRIEMRYQQGEMIIAGAHCIVGPVTAHLKFTLKAE